MIPEEKRAREALERIPVANYATGEVWLEVAVLIISQAIAQAVAEEREACARKVFSLALQTGLDLEIADNFRSAIRARGSAL